ncbi:J domain-containing protein [Methylobacter sp.]|uniref:J domain-containing protein n=1 Tax=Methylobacter sp. TaxID=2051955 RepID=UPI00121FF10B|nr:J domain-containing protein [Methylobacter sp.]TAK64866.1 MAG: J domain-containing protein [Methylobacter sp.]
MYSTEQLVDRTTPVKDQDTQLAVISANPLDLPAATFQEGLDRRKQNRAALMAWIRDALVDGTDFGRVHLVNRSKCQAGASCQNPRHFSKSSLFKPGAEKICGMLGVTVRYPSLPEYEKAALTGTNLSQIIIRCEIVDASGRVVADGIGARIIAQDNGDINKSLKMAEKSAHVDATLRMAGLSEVFTQDIEDMVQRREAESIHKAESELNTGFEGISKTQHQQLEAKIKELGLDRTRVKEWMAKASHNRFTSFLELNQDFYQILYNKLDQFAESGSMTVKEALSILGLSAFADQEAIKTAYRKACIKYRPNKNQAGPEMMKAINAAHLFLKEIAYNGVDHPVQEEVNSDFGDMLNDAINAVISLDGVTIIIRGAGAWLSGNTKEHKEAIKAAGYRWDNKKAAWYFRLTDHKSSNKGECDMEKSGDTGDSTTLNSEPHQERRL